MPNQLAASRRDPWPYHMRVNGVPVLLAENDDGELISQKSQTLEGVQPTDYNYGSLPPYLERTFEMRHLFYGMGQRVQNEQSPGRYWYALDTDLSVNGKWMRGPATTIETIAAGKPIRGIVTALHGGVETLFVLAGDRVYRRTGDGSYTLSLTLPSGTCVRAARFKGAGGSPIDALYLTTTATNLYRYDGAVWTVAGAGAGPFSDMARNIIKIGNELWIAGDVWVAKVEVNPMVRADYAGLIYVGDASSTVTWLSNHNDVLLIHKSDGHIYTLSQDGYDQDLLALGQPSTSFGVNAASWLSDLYVPTGGDPFYRIDAQGGADPLGTEQMLDNGSEVAGRIVASAGHATFYNYVGLYNATTGHSHLLKLGSWVDLGERAEDATQFLRVYNGSLKKWTGKQITWMSVESAAHFGTNERLYVGFLDGTVEWIVLPRGGPDPSSDTACSFTVSDGYLYWPDHHMNYEADSKSYRGFSFFGPRLDTNNYAQVEYRTDPTASFTALQAADISGVLSTADFVLSGQRQDFPTGTQVFGKSIQIRALLRRAGAALAAETIILDGMALHEQVRPSLRFDDEWVVLAYSDAAKRDGSSDRRRPEAIKAAMEAAAGAVGTIPVVMPWGATEEVSIIDIREALVSATARRGIELRIPMKAVRFRTISTGQQQLTHGRMETYTHSQLRQVLR